jgi:hypothetical protein
MGRSLSIHGLWLVVAAWPVVAQATLAVPVSLEQMTRESEVIVHARVLDQRVTWSDDHARILTLTRIQTLQGLKGATKGETLTIYQVGGELDGLVYRIPGALAFAPGEEIVFFAVRLESWIVSYGMGVGKYLVVDEKGTRTVEARFGDVAFVGRTPTGELVAAAPLDAGPIPLDTFLARVRALVAGGGR